jgi:hypothetical protein
MLFSPRLATGKASAQHRARERSAFEAPARLREVAMKAA